MAVFCMGCGLFLFSGVTNIRHLLDNIVASYLLVWALYGMFARVPLPEVGTRFLLTTGAIALCLLVVEGAVLIGAVDYRSLLGSYEQDNVLSLPGRRFDNELLWRHDPYYRFEAAYQGNLGQALCIPPDPARKVAVRYDHNGFRNDRRLSEAGLVVIGDSYIEGYLTSETKLITTVLSELQGQPVANLGHSGYGPQQELAVLRRFGLPLKPKTVVWAFFEGNDFLDADDYENRVSASGNAFWQDLWFRSLTRNVAALMFRSTQQCVPSESVNTLRAEFTDAQNMTETVFFAPTEVERPSDSALYKAAASIAEAAKLCRERNIRFIVAFVPEKYRVYHDLENVSLATNGALPWPTDDLPEKMRRLLTTLEPSIEYVDLTSPLKTASRKGIATYLPDDTHWTDEGNRVAAEALHQALESIATVSAQP
ncbi:MAG: rane protein of unknown function [Nitrospira sp.]|nr:rane protein of unknown function [Nitrospira sp.]